MSSYGYGPPPPPPPASSGQPAYGHNASYQQGSGRHGGGSHNRGRGGHYSGGRGGYQPAAPTHYEYPNQSYPPHGSTPYVGGHPQPGAYPAPQPQWTPDAAQGQPHHTHPHSHPHPHAPAPISSSNYHPNYAPQPYPPSQYPQQPSYGAPQYGHSYQATPPPAPSQWSGQGPSQQAPYGAGRHRGGYSDRGGHKLPPPMGPPVRHGYEHEAAPPPMNGMYSHPYPHEHHAGSYPPQYSYAAPPPPPQGPPHHRDSYYGQHPRRGRGGGHRDGHARGRGGHHGHDRPRPHKHNNIDNNKPEAPSAGKKKKRKMNTLGLTPGMDSESEDDEGEEKLLIDLIGHDTLSVSDVAAYLSERRKNFPTKARVDAKKSQVKETSEDKAAELEKQADKLRRQLRKVESSIKRKREQGDEGDEMRDSSPEESSDDEKPEVQSSRPQNASRATPPSKKADVSKHCKYFSTGGTCGKKGKCRFVHDPEVREAAMKEREANNGRMTIQQRLILNDKEQEDLTVLQSIQYLRDKGLMPAAAPEETKKSNGEKLPTSGATSGTSLLPAASASLPPPPVKREAGTSRRNPPPSIIPSANSTNAQGLKHYQGWLLKPYGSTNGKQPKSDDLP